MSKNWGLVSVNGHIVHTDDAKISVYDRGFLFGDSLYEATLAVNGIPSFWKEHWERLLQTADLIGMPVTYSENEIKKYCKNILEKTIFEKAYLRIILTRGNGPVNLAPPLDYSEIKNNLVIYSIPINHPKDWLDVGVKYAISSVERNAPKALNPKAKTGNYLNNQLALQEAKKRGFLDAIMLNRDGFITEGTTNNFWMIKDKVIYTPAARNGLLLGVTRKNLFHLCQKHNISCVESDITVEMALMADEAFFTSATKSVVPIVQLDHWQIGNGKPGVLTLKVRELYENFLSDDVKSFKWN